MVDPTNPDIKAKFGDSTVSDAFTHLHTLINDGSADFTAIIALGDYIDLPSLTVAGYPTDNTTDGYGKITATDAELSGHGRLLRLIVVGINSFNGKNDNNTPHVVFQFQNLPGTRRMNASGTNVGGYKDSEIRKYLVEVGGAGGNFLAGLTAAGVPASVLWAPSCRVWNGYLSGDTNGSPTNTTVDTIADALFLPTEWEMFGSNTYSNGTYETAANQGRLEYYAGGTSKIKYDSGNTAKVYWEASPDPASVISFCFVSSNGSIYHGNPSSVGGCAPAFCVK